MNLINLKKMDKLVKEQLNKFFIRNYSKYYNSSPQLKEAGDDYFYTINKDCNIICLIPISLLGTEI